MARLRRILDGAGDEGSRVESIKYEDNSNKFEIVGHEPIVGTCLLVGSVTTRTVSPYDFWITSEITEIIEHTYNYYKFKTKNSTYEFWK